MSELRTELRLYSDKLEDMLFHGLDVRIIDARMENGAVLLRIEGSDVPGAGTIPFVTVHTRTEMTTVLRPLGRLPAKA